MGNYKMRTYQRIIKERMEENRNAIKDIERTKPLWFTISKMQKDYGVQFGSFWCDYDGINAFINNLTKKEAFILLDEIFWSNDIETTDPSFINGRLRVKYECPEPVFGEGLRPSIIFIFEIKMDDNCRKVHDGWDKIERYKWICD